MKHLIHKDDFDETLQRLIGYVSKLERGVSWSVEIKPYRKARTNQQLRYFFGVICKRFSEETGATPEETKELLLGEYFGWETRAVNTPKGTSFSSGGGHTKFVLDPVRTLTSPEPLSRQEISVFFDWCIQLAATNGWVIPYPMEVDVE